MLVLSRKTDEIICIGDEVQVMVVGVSGNKVSLGIEAPGWMQVHRKEVYDARKREGLDTHSREPASCEGESPEPATPAGCDDVGTLRAALEESVALQSYYASLLNMHDGGGRIGFANADAWIDRLRVTGRLEQARSGSPA